MKNAVNQENLGPLIYANNVVIDEIKKYYGGKIVLRLGFLLTILAKFFLIRLENSFNVLFKDQIEKLH